MRQRYFGRALVINYRISTNPKLGITVPRQFGNAVKRNRFKRHVREAFRLHRPYLGPIDMVVLPKREATNFSLELITKDLLECNHEHAQPTAAKSC